MRLGKSPRTLPVICPPSGRPRFPPWPWSCEPTTAIIMSRFGFLYSVTFDILENSGRRDNTVLRLDHQGGQRFRLPGMALEPQLSFRSARNICEVRCAGGAMPSPTAPMVRASPTAFRSTGSDSFVRTYRRDHPRRTQDHLGSPKHWSRRRRTGRPKTHPLMAS